MNKETKLKIAQLEGEILDIMDDLENGAAPGRSDLQGFVSAIIEKAYKLGTEANN